MSVKEQNTVRADRQLRGNPRITYFGQKGIKVLIVGNSITRHPPASEIGWENDCGMAASSPEKDYVHLLYKKLNKNASYCFLVMQMADFEQSFQQKGANEEDIRRIHEFSPEIIVGRLSENVSSQNCANNAWFNEYGRLLKACGNAESKYIITTGFWKSDEVDKQTRCLAAENDWKLVELGDLGEDSAMQAGKKFWHAGVSVHPGDAGMRIIAERIYQAVLEVENA